jgi:drug/metabolite transporter (DMT)-like permease
VPRHGQTRAYLLLVLIVSIWASYPAMGKLALRDFPPFFLAVVRCSIASAFLVGLLVRAGGEPFRQLSPAAWRAFLVLGISGYWLSTQFSYLGYYFTTAANAVILQTATPVLVAIGARVYLGERLSALQRSGAAVSVLGVLLVITNGRLALLRPDEMRAGDFITVGALTGWAVYTVYGKRVLTRHSPEVATTIAYVLGTLLMIPTAVVTAPFFPAPRLESAVAWSVVLYQAVIGALAHVWWYRAVNVVGPSIAAIFVNLQPVVGVALAWLVLAETIGTWQLTGGALVVAGVGIVTWGAPRGLRTRPPRPPTSGVTPAS